MAATPFISPAIVFSLSVLVHCNDQMLVFVPSTPLIRFCPWQVVHFWLDWSPSIDLHPRGLPSWITTSAVMAPLNYCYVLLFSCVVVFNQILGHQYIHVVYAASRSSEIRRESNARNVWSGFTRIVSTCLPSLMTTTDVTLDWCGYVHAVCFQTSLHLSCWTTLFP